MFIFFISLNFSVNINLVRRRSGRIVSGCEYRLDWTKNYSVEDSEVQTFIGAEMDVGYNLVKEA